ncbi:MAG: site-2 protease family protein [Kiritimatiellae bacterium]|nr:site-2 protease family protein [Kiritimatiellia bacterium]
MRWALPVGSVLGVRIRIHATFLLILAWFGWLGWREGGVVTGVWAVALILSLFMCVVLHELGHSVVAMRFGAEVRSITLLPIGGVAQMRKIPEKPYQEFLVALAGPAVNVLLAGLLVLVRGGFPGWVDVPLFPRSVGGLADALVRANIVLAVFNLLPAFPMDGGRVLRSTLARFMKYTRATSLAAAVGQLVAVGFILLGLFHNPFLVLIGLFVLFGAQSEERYVRVRGILRDMTAEDVMQTDFASLDVEDPLERCLEYVYHRRQENFPVLSEGRLAGVLPRKKWLAALHAQGAQVKVGQLMQSRFIALDPACPLVRIYQDLWSSEQGVFPVVREGRLVGLLTAEDLGRYIMVQQARPSGRNGLFAPARGGRASRFMVDLG